MYFFQFSNLWDLLKSLTVNKVQHNIYWLQFSNCSYWKKMISYFSENINIYICVYIHQHMCIQSLKVQRKSSKNFCIRRFITVEYICGWVDVNEYKWSTKYMSCKLCSKCWSMCRKGLLEALKAKWNVLIFYRSAQNILHTQGYQPLIARALCVNMPLTIM